MLVHVAFVLGDWLERYANDQVVMTTSICTYRAKCTLHLMEHLVKSGCVRFTHCSIHCTPYCSINFFPTQCSPYLLHPLLSLLLHKLPHLIFHPLLHPLRFNCCSIDLTPLFSTGDEAITLQPIDMVLAKNC